jgi:hypothetical protein
MTDNQATDRRLVAVHEKFGLVQREMEPIFGALLGETTTYIRERNDALREYILPAYAGAIGTKTPAELKVIKDKLNALNNTLDSVVHERIGQECWWPHRDLVWDEAVTWLSSDKGLFFANNKRNPEDGVRAVLGMAVGIWHDGGVIGEAPVELPGKVAYVQQYGTQPPRYIWNGDPFSNSPWPPLPSLQDYRSRLAILTELQKKRAEILEEIEREKAKSLWDRA